MGIFDSIINAAITTVGIGGGLYGLSEIIEGDNIMRDAEGIVQEAQDTLNFSYQSTQNTMKKITERELNILASFKMFSDLIENIQEKPQFKNYEQNKYDLPELKIEEIKNASLGADLLCMSIESITIGAMSGIMISGAIEKLASYIGSKINGNKIKELSDEEIQLATKKFLGDGDEKNGEKILKNISVTAGIFAGGILFGYEGHQYAETAKQAYTEAEDIEFKIIEIVDYLERLNGYAGHFNRTLKILNKKYLQYLDKMDYIVTIEKKTNWNDFTDTDKIVIQNTVLLVGYLYKMCRTNLVKKETNEDNFNLINSKELKKTIQNGNELEKQITI